MERKCDGCGKMRHDDADGWVYDNYGPDREIVGWWCFFCRKDGKRAMERERRKDAEQGVYW